MYQLINFKTKKVVKPKNFVFTGADAPYEVVMDLESVKSRINTDYFKRMPPYASKYLPFMPIENYADFVSLSEGATPLIKSKVIGPQLGINLYFKQEAVNPTGSFKDRGSAVEMTVAKSMKVKAIAVASTGNMAASCSCYATAAGIPCFVFVPEGTPATKLAQVISYGGKIVQVKGSYNDAAKLAQKVAEELDWYLAGDYAYRTEGQKTAAFEIIDQLFYRVPDMVVVPMGCGTNIASYGKGFREYQKLGYISTLPQLIGVQAIGASSIVNSFAAKKKDVTPLAKIDTIASAIAVTYPLDGIKALDEIYASNGSAVSCNDTELLEAQYDLAKLEGLFVEVSSASSVAAIKKMATNKSLKNKTVVCTLTGNGLKDPSPILKIAIKPPTIHPDIAEFLNLYKKRFFDGTNVSFVAKEQVMFKSVPTKETIAKAAFKHFRTNLSDVYIQNIREQIAKFMKKGKTITFADFEDVMQDVLERLQEQKKKVFKVLDFTVQTGKDTKSEAQVVVKINGDIVEEQADGVGPVDAVINALRKACGKKLEFTLTNYKVEIRSSGTDAVVYVETTLVKAGQPSHGNATSPDIIQASIEAFEEAYNGF